MLSNIIQLWLAILFFICPYLTAKNLSLESRINPPARELMDVEVIGNLLIVPGNLDGYDFYDISVPNDPQHITNFQVPMNNNRSLPGFWVCATDSFAYFTSRSKGSGSAIVDISDPDNPINSGYLSWGGNSDLILEGLDINDSILAVAAHDDGVLIYNIENPTYPSLISQVYCGNAWDVELDSSLLIVGSGEDGVKFFDISNLNNPVLIAEHNTLGTVKDIELVSNLLYIAVGSAGIELLDVSDPHSLLTLDTYNTPGLANKISCMDNNLVAVSDWQGVIILEWTGSVLELAGYKQNGYRTMAIGTKGNTIYSAEWQHLQTYSYGEIQAADIDLSSWEISFPQLEIGQKDTIKLVLESSGQFPIGMNQANLTHPDFELLHFENYIDPGDSLVTEIVYTRSDLNASGILQFNSNDEDEPYIGIDIIGNYDGAMVGQDAPDFTLPIVSNGSGNFTLSDHIGQIVMVAFFAPG